MSLHLNRSQQIAYNSHYNQTVSTNEHHRRISFLSNTVQTETNPESVGYQIKSYLKASLQQKDPIKKLMISCILAGIYIQQYNYQQAYKILTDTQKTISTLEQASKAFQNRLSQQDQLQLALIKLKMYSHFILIEMINLQLKPLELHLEQALQVIDTYRHKTSKKAQIPEEPVYHSQNKDPNDRIRSINEQNNRNANTMLMLFQMLLKGLTGFESFEGIQAETLIAQFNMEKTPCDNLEQFFYFSNMSFLKLLSTSDYQAAYKLESNSFDFVEIDIEESRRNGKNLSLKQVVLKTVTLKKLLYLSEELKLPVEIIKKYKQKLNSCESLQSKYLEGLQENTIFRNYKQKIDLGFKIVSRLKNFQAQVILPMMVSFNSNQFNSKYGGDSKNYGSLKLWQCKALKSKLNQILSSKLLQNNENARLNIILVIECLQESIQRQILPLNSSKSGTIELSIEEMILLETIGCKKDANQSLGSKKSKKHQSSPSLYESAVNQYRSKLQILVCSIEKIIVVPLKTEFFENLEQLQQPVIEVEISHVRQTQQREQENNKSQTESQPSIYLDDVQFQLINQKPKTEQAAKTIKESKLIGEAKNNHRFENYSKKHESNSIPMYVIEDQPSHKKTYLDNLVPAKLTPMIPTQPTFMSKLSPLSSKIKEHSKFSPKKNIFLNQKNQVYVNYAQLGSRVKLNQHKPQQSSQISHNSLSPKTQNFQTFTYAPKNKNYARHQESVKNDQGQIEIPPGESIVKYAAKMYEFEGKSQGNIVPLSHNNLNKSGDREDQKQKFSIIQSFKQKTKQSHLQLKSIQEDEKSIEQNPIEQTHSASKSRKKMSSLSPKVPKDSTIHSRLNQHIKRHELTYSPDSLASGMKLKKPQISLHPLKQKQNNQYMEREKSVSEQSAGLSPSSRSKIRPKIQKASVYPKSPVSASNPFQTKPIKYKQFMQGLQKSGVNIREDEPFANYTASRPKIQSKSAHRRIATQANQLHLEKYQSYMNDARSKIKETENNKTNSVLEAFFADPQKNSKRHNIFQKPSSEQGSSPDDNPVNLTGGVVPRTRRTGSELIPTPQTSLTGKENVSQKQTKIPVSQSRPLPPQKPKGSVKSSESVANEENQQKSLQSSALSLDVIKKYILKMMKTHQQKLSHAIKLCENGQYVDKKHYSSDGGDERFLQLSQDHKFIEWAVTQNKLLQGHKTKYEIKLVKGVVYGKVTETMRKLSNKNLEPFKCISLIFQKRTFDIYCTQEQDIKFWLPGISCFVGQSRPPLNHPNYTTNIQKFIKKRLKPAKKDELHENTVYYSLGRVLWKKMLLKMQFKFLKAKKTYNYKNLNAGGIIEFSKALREKEGMSFGSMLPPSGKGSKKSREN